MLNSKKLRKDINSRLDAWNERAMFTLNGIKYLSRSDMDTLLMFCDLYERSGSLSGYLLVGGVKEVLISYGLEV